MISFVIPAHNEEVCLPVTLKALLAAANQVNQPYEVIVVNDSSTDRTAAIAKEHGVRVLDVHHRQIAATRNSGGRAARGDILFFVDADTQATAAAIRAALKAIDRGAAGGGCMFRYDGWVPLWIRVLLPISNILGRVSKLVGGWFLFCRRVEFEAVGGFNEQLYASEDMAFVQALKRRGPFAVPREEVLTSNRQVCTMTLGRALPKLYRLFTTRPESYTSREGLEHWYDPRMRGSAAEAVLDPKNQ